MWNKKGGFKALQHYTVTSMTKYGEVWLITSCIGLGQHQRNPFEKSINTPMQAKNTNHRFLFKKKNAQIDKLIQNLLSNVQHQWNHIIYKILVSWCSSSQLYIFETHLIEVKGSLSLCRARCKQFLWITCAQRLNESKWQTSKMFTTRDTDIHSTVRAPIENVKISPFFKAGPEKSLFKL